VTAFALAAPANAQYYTVGGGTITLYASPAFTGGHRTYTVPMRSLAPAGFNNVATSAIVASGVWQVCTGQNFAGRCVTLKPGRYPQLANIGMDYRIVSLRPVGQGNPPPSYGYPGPPPQMAAPALSLFIYDQRGLSGRAYQLKGPIGNLASVGWGGRARSASVVAGRWQLCAGIGYRPPCITLNPGRYDNLADTHGNLWSARPL
jgi:hypothetical protein